MGWRYAEFTVMSSAVIRERGPQMVYDRCQQRINGEIGATYDSPTFHDQNQRVGGHVPGIRQSVLFPQLTKKIRPTRHIEVVVDKVALKEAMNSSSLRFC